MELEHPDIRLQRTKSKANRKIVFRFTIFLPFNTHKLGGLTFRKLQYINYYSLNVGDGQMRYSDSDEGTFLQR